MAAKRGDRKLQILHALAEMLEAPAAEKITTAALAARLDVSEAALYRHFASKAQMFEGLIEFIEQTVFGLINKISVEQESGAKQVPAILGMLLGFAEKNPGMTRGRSGGMPARRARARDTPPSASETSPARTLKQCLR